MGISKGNKVTKNIIRKALSDGPSAILKLFYKSNVAKGSILKWSQNHIFIARSPVSDLAIFLF